MIFRCHLCRKFKVWNEDKGYRIIATNKEHHLAEVKICQPCGDSINAKYEQGKSIADMEIIEESNE